MVIFVGSANIIVDMIKTVRVGRKQAGVSMLNRKTKSSEIMFWADTAWDELVLEEIGLLEWKVTPGP